MMLTRPGAGNMEIRTNQGLWNLFACSTVLLLLLSSVAQRQLQSFHASIQPPKEVGEDFPIYYSAGKIARLHGDRTLYYPAPNGERLTVRNLLDPVPPNTTWSRVAEASGFHNTGRFMAPPFMALLDEPFALMRPATALLAWRLASTLMLVVAIYLSIILFNPPALLRPLRHDGGRGILFLSFYRNPLPGPSGCPRPASMGPGRLFR